jgi:hypothetical protein
MSNDISGLVKVDEKEKIKFEKKELDFSSPVMFYLSKLTLLNCFFALS